MPGIQASGIGSGLDINSLVSQLVAAERAPQQQRLDRSGARIDTRLSALGTMKGALSSLQSAVGALRTASQLTARKAEVSDATVMRATATASAAAGSHSVEVLSLASAQKLASQAYAGGSAATVGTGSLTFSQGGRSFSVTASAGATLATLRDAINGAVGNTGLRASLLQVDGGTRLVLAATASGSAQAFRIAATDAAGGLDAFAYDPDGPKPMTQLVAAADAQAKVEGYPVSAAGNRLEGVIEGVTLDLLAAKPGTAVTVTVSRDDGAVRERLGRLVSDYNSMAATLGRLRAFDPATRSGGPLVGDAMLLGIESRLRRELTAVAPAAADAPDTLSAIGIGFTAEGRLQLDEARLSKALAADAAAVAQLLAGEGGIARRLHATLAGALGTGGELAARNESLLAQKRDLQKARETLDLRMQAVERRYRAQFTALDSMLSEMQSTGNYLARQLK